MQGITFEICWGISYRRRRTEPGELLIGDLITHCKDDYQLAEQNRQTSEVIRYSFYRGEGIEKERLDPTKTLRELRIRTGDILYLSPHDHPWWRDHFTGGADRPPSTTVPSGATGQAGRSHRPATTERPTPCQVELAPGCTLHVPETGLTINRDFLKRSLPRSVLAMELARSWVNLPSKLDFVSNRDMGHCMIRWNHGWYLFAHKPIYIGGVKYDNGEAIPLEQTTTLLLGRMGWPITVRLNTLSMPI